MFNTTEVSEKELHAKMAAQQYGELRGLSTGCAEASRPSLRDRCRDAEYRAQHESFKAQRMCELGVLLDKNPEVARILDLIEEVR